MGELRKTGLVAIAALALSALDVWAAATGSLGGVVRDDGSPRAGVALTLSGRYLQGVRRTISGEGGRYAFNHLPPGDGYVLRAEVEGRPAARIESVNVRLGEEATLDVALVPGFTEELSVSVERPLLDLRNPGRATVVTRAEIDALPTRRDFQRLAEVAPGVRFDRDDLNPAVGGSTPLENDYVIDGLSTRSALSGASGTLLTLNFVQEVQIATGEMPAEFGRVTGGVINVVTRSGSNTFHGDVFGYVRNDDWASRNITHSSRGTDGYDLGHDLEDWGVAIGGPIVRDRLWFFGSLGPRDDVWTEDIVNGRFGIRRTEPFESERDVYAGSFDAVLSSSHALALSAFGDPATTTGWYGLAQADPSSARLRTESGSTNLAFRYSGLLSAELAVDAMLGRHEESSSREGEIAKFRDVPQQIEQHPAGGFAAIHGGPSRSGESESSIGQFLANASIAFGRHDLRLGASLERALYESSEVAQAFVFAKQVMISPVIGRRDRLWEEFVDNSGHGSNDTLAAYVQDRWDLRQNVSLSLGLRWERQQLDSGRGVTIATGVAVDGSITGRPADEFALEDTWAPRLGISWDPTGNGRTKLFAFGGRYFATVPVGINVAAMNGYGYTVRQYYSDVVHTSENWWNPSGSPLGPEWVLFRTESSRDPEVPSPIDPQTKAQYDDEVSLGGEIVIGSAWRLGIRGVARELSRAIEDVGVFSPGDPTDWIGGVIANPGETSYGQSMPEPKRSYRAIEVTASRRLTDRWQLAASFVSSRETGNYDGYSYLGVGTGCCPNVSPAFDGTRVQTYADGKLRFDIPYELKLHGSYRFPFGVTVSEAFVYSAGYPVSKRVAAPGWVMFVTERGSEGRTPDHWTLDLHVGWEVPFVRAARLMLVADVFNVTGEHEALAVDELYAYPGMPGWEAWYAEENLDEYGVPMYDPSLPGSPYWGTPTLYQRGREIQLGVRLSY